MIKIRTKIYNNNDFKKIAKRLARLLEKITIVIVIWQQ